MTTATAPATLRRVRPAGVASRTVPHLRLLRHEPDPDGPTVVEPERPTTPPGTVPDDLHETADLRKRAHHVLCLVLEVLDGRRPHTHLTAHLQPPALRYVRAAVGRPTPRRPSRLTSLHVSRPCTGAVEVAAVHHTGDRTRVLAARFEGRPEQPARWRCVTLRLL